MNILCKSDENKEDMKFWISVIFNELNIYWTVDNMQMNIKVDDVIASQLSIYFVNKKWQKSHISAMRK